VLSLAVAASVVVLGAERQKPRGSDNLRVALGICVKADDIELQIECFKGEFARAASSDTFPELYKVMEDIERINPKITYGCHIGAHRAGKLAAYELDPIAVVQVGITERHICSNGFIHGALEGIGEQDTGVEQYQDISQLCLTLPGESRLNGCVDGFGHSAWLRHGNIAEATRLCMFFPAIEEQMVCIRGILMEMNFFNSVGGGFLLDPDRRDLYCNAVRQVTDTPELVDACYAGVALGLTRAAAELTLEAIQLRPAGIGEWLPEPPVLARLSQEWNQVLASCGTWGEQAEICHRAVLQELQWELGDADPMLCLAIIEDSSFRREDDCSGPQSFFNRSPDIVSAARE
jgi:hypothetical protein